MQILGWNNVLYDKPHEWFDNSKTTKPRVQLLDLGNIDRPVYKISVSSVN